MSLLATIKLPGGSTQQKIGNYTWSQLSTFVGSSGGEVVYAEDVALYGGAGAYTTMVYIGIEPYFIGTFYFVGDSNMINATNYLYYTLGIGAVSLAKTNITYI
jgi:hypothetical protein